MAKKIKVRASMVFERYEKKYLLTEEQYHQLLCSLEEHMHRDQYGLHTICSLYMDSDDFLLVRRSMEKPEYKEKLRLRSYGIPRPDSTVFLELKKKFKGVTYKRRIPIPFAEAEAFLLDGVQPRQDSQILREINYFLGMYDPAPKVMLLYERLALFGKEDEDLRITFDENIRWRAHQLSFSFGDAGEPLLPPGMRLMEIKISDAFPIWLTRMLAELKIYPVSYSKYGNAYKRLMERGKNRAEQHSSPA